MGKLELKELDGNSKPAGRQESWWWTKSVVVLLRHLPRRLPVNACLCCLLHHWWHFLADLKPSASSQAFFLPNVWLTFFSPHPIPLPRPHFFMKESILLTPNSLFLVPHFGFRFFNNGEIKRATVSNFFRSVGKICYEELDWTMGISSGKHFWLDCSSFLS